MKHLAIISLFSYFVLTVSEDALVRFMILGDWGKGGSPGAYISAVQTPLKEGEQVSGRGALRRIAAEEGGGNAEAGNAGAGGEGGNKGGEGEGGGNKGGEGGGNNGGGGKKGGQTYYQVAVAKAMNQFASSATPAPEFIIALGDNFYDSGVQSSTDVYWDYLWKQVYIEPYESLNIPWYVTPGNHDYGGSVQAQIDRYHEHQDDDIWMMPATNFTKVFTSSGSSGSSVTVGVVFVDTATLAPQANNCCNENKGISTDEQARRIKDQLQHLKKDFESLKSNPPDWTIVVGHYPIYSAGDHCDNSELISYLLPLMQYYGVDAYIAGHDHISEHLEYQDIHHFIAGAGALTDSLNSKCSSKAELKWYGVGYSAFGNIDATSTSFTVNYIDTNNEVKYSYSIEKQARSPTASPTKSPPTTRNPSNSVTDAPTILIVPKQPDGESSNRASYLPSTQVVSISGAAVAIAAVVFFFFYRFYNRKGNSKVKDESTTEIGKTHKMAGPATPKTPMKTSTSPSAQQKRIAKNYMKFTNSTRQPDSYISDDDNFNDDDDEETGPPTKHSKHLRSSPASLANGKSLYAMVEMTEKSKNTSPNKDSPNKTSPSAKEMKKPRIKGKDAKYSPVKGGEEVFTPYSPSLTGAADDNHNGRLFTSIHTPGNQPALHRRAYTSAL